MGCVDASITGWPFLLFIIDGLGVRRDYKMAIKFFNLASQTGKLSVLFEGLGHEIVNNEFIQQSQTCHRSDKDIEIYKQIQTVNKHQGNADKQNW